MQILNFINNGRIFKISFKKLFFPLLIFLIIVIILLKFSELRKIGRLFMQIRWYWLILVLIAQFINLSIKTAVYKKILNVLKFPHINFFEFTRISLVVIFLNSTIPSYGFAGNIYLIKLLNKKFGFKEGKILMMIILELISYYFSLILLITTALIYIFIKIHRLNYLSIITAVGFILLCFLVAFILYFLLGNRQKAPKKASWFIKRIYKAEDGISPEKKAEILLKEFYQNVDWLKQHKRQIFIPILLQFVKFLSDGLTIFIIFLAFGALTSYGISLTTYALGQLFGLASLIPGGMGAFEGAMTLTSNSLGVTLELSIAVMLIYRFFSYWLYFPLGLIFYHQINRKIKVNNTNNNNGSASTEL